MNCVMEVLIIPADFEDELHSEMEKVELFDALTEAWTYPEIQQLLVESCFSH